MAVLKVLPKGGGMIMDHAAMANNTRRFHGWTHDRTQGPIMKDPETGQEVRNGVYRKESAVIELPASAEYIRALRGDPRQGTSSADFWPADQATADLVGVKFDPNFGGEHPSLVKPVPTPSAPAIPIPVSAKAGS